MVIASRGQSVVDTFRLRASAWKAITHFMGGWSLVPNIWIKQKLAKAAMFHTCFNFRATRTRVPQSTNWRKAKSLRME